MAKARVLIRPKEGILDPQGKAVERALPALGFEVAFDGDRTSIRRVNVASVDELTASLPLWQRMKDALRDGPQTLASLAADLNAPVDSIHKTVRRKSLLFTKVSNFDDRVTRIALVERRAS